ncbi:TonB-dependent receptor [Gilvimarinus agarilyticus]|uniref:TonB-dependent receptor n=1 Tax=Gilvimarinus sp. 2_MG-2023 TaxID=3062666 RepID=UPI001C0A3B47|nr:TonB-dependent receptor [Gilvimarinus sp. 2_MG-2023]MBU2886722.1 TonB-dependent receptor [Gilvimarinus agarilyticus]MDO6571388.1 TonB-dependent receptor [Gilvimarinus sp. 2_MG-2023]
MSSPSQPHTKIQPVRYTRNILAAAIAASLLPSSIAFAQEEGGAELLEEVIVTGSFRDIMRNSIEIKRDAETIVDVISASDMGALPDLSVAETLERIVGVTGDRFKGNSSEISVRGLGPFLGYSTYNGREVSSGSGNRSIAFSQFPSELVNGAVVYKSQSADLVEGGVAGLINLQSIRPLEYGKRRFQAEIKGNYNDYDAKLNDDDGIGYRGSISYTDVFETGIGDIGIAIGYAGHDSSTPEESFNASSTLRNCNSDYINDGLSGGWNACSWSDDNTAANGGEAADGDYYYIPNLFYIRQMESEESRDAVMTTVQWEPNEDWSIIADAQWSNRFYYEDRHDLYFDDGRNNIAQWETNDDHALVSYTGHTRLGTYGEYRERDEDYMGGGLNFAWSATDRLVLTADISYSDTTRYQETWQTRFRSDRLWYDYVSQGSDSFPAISIYEDLDDPAGSQIDDSLLNDFSLYDANQRARYGELEVNDTISALAIDAVYELKGNFFTSLETGARISSHEHSNYAEDRIEYTGTDFADVNTIEENCATVYPQESYGEDANSSITEWATFDTMCAFNSMWGGDDWALSPQDPSAADINLTEDISAIFAKLNFASQIGSIDVSGNVGVRVVETSIDSTGYRQDYSVIENDAGTPNDPEDDSFYFDPVADNLASEVYSNSYVNVLPSVNVNFGLSETVQLRTAVYSAISRPDMWWMGAGRNLDLGDGEEEFSSIEDAIAAGTATAQGNPNMEATESVNYDLSLSWFPRDDTMLSAAFYYKEFEAGLQVADPSSIQESFNINGELIEMDVNGLIQNTSESSSISGVELSLQHGFTHLPEPLDGLGIMGGINIADTDFEYQENGSSITDDVFVEPANLPGFSKESYNAEIYWENYGFTTRLSYKYRSDYLKPFGSDFGQTNRFVDDTSSVDFSLAYNLTKNLQIKMQALNLTNEPYVEYRVAQDSFTRIEYSGTKYFFGVRYKM